MSRKAFHVGIDLDIHAVTCPGVWLCPKGGAMLRVSMLGATTHTKRIEPTFPLLFHESFQFRKTLTGIRSLSELQAELSRRKVHLQLVQWQVHGCRCVLLAAFCSPLTELLYPQSAARGRVTGVDVDLLMETTPCFPGIISPKVEVSTRVVIEEMVNFPIHGQEFVTINHKTLTSKKAAFRRGFGEKKGDVARVKTKIKPMVNAGRSRQKPVCHTRPRVKCNGCRQSVDWRGQREGRGGTNDTLYLPYCNKCGDVAQEDSSKQGKVIIKDALHDIGTWEAACSCLDPQPSKSVCDCGLCRKYNDYFKKLDLSTPQSDVSERSNILDLRVEQRLSPREKTDACCPCCNNKQIENQSRQRAGCTQNSCKRVTPPLDHPTWADSADQNGDDESDETQKKHPDNLDYKNMFNADLEKHYKRLYERVSRRNNRKEN